MRRGGHRKVFANLSLMCKLEIDEQKNSAPHPERFLDSRSSARFAFQPSSLNPQPFFQVSYLSIALQRCAERRQLNQSDLAKQSGISRSYISRLFSGVSSDLSDDNFVAVLKVFVADPAAQAEIIAARCMDVLAVARTARTPGAELVTIAVKSADVGTKSHALSGQDFPEVELSHETEKAFTWLRSQCPVNPDLEKHLVGYAKLTGMP